MKTHRAGTLSLLLRDLFPSDQHTHVTELPWTYAGQVRRIDQVAWEHRRASTHAVIGFEIKTSRSDLLQELRDPEKWHAAREICDRFYLVVGDPEMNMHGIPSEWGIIAPEGESLSVVREAARLRHPTYGVPRDLVGAFLRKLRADLDEEAKHVHLKVRMAEDRGQRIGFNEARRMYRKMDRELVA